MNRRTWLYFAAALMLALAVVGLGGAANAYVSARPADSATVGQPPADDKPTQVDCSQVSALGIDRQTNLHAAEALARCGQATMGNGIVGNGSATLGGSPRTSPGNYGGADVNTILPDGTSPHITQSETFIWGHGTTIVSTINDSRIASSCYSGGSVSTDNGVTWTHIGGAGTSPFCVGHGTGYGDPTGVWDEAHSKWVASFLASGCGGQGIGIWTSTDGVNWTTGSCAHNGSQDDRQSSWVDNNPASPYYGRVYITFANYNVSGPPISVIYSTDGGTTWTTPLNLPVPAGTTFVRNVQDTGSPNGDGTFIVAAMDEGGGGLANRRNFIYRSTNGGVTFDPAIQVGAPFPGPGQGSSGYFATMFGNTYWRHMGWGQPAVGGRIGGQNVVHLTWAQHGPGTDYGDVYYARSTDNGSTWGTPVKLNTDTTTKRQWQPNVAANATGGVLAGWYDQRNGGEPCTVGGTAPCYERFGRVSTDNGATWQPDQPISDVVSPLPAQPDSAVQATYAGDYDYASAQGTDFYQTWVDGRVLIGGASQQDVFFDRIPVIQGTPTPTVTGTPPSATPTRTYTQTPTATATVCGGTSPYSVATATGATVVPATTFVAGSNCDDCSSAIALPFPFRLYDQTFTTVNAISNGNLQFLSSDTAYTNTCLPDAAANYAIFPHWDDLLLTGANQGIYTLVEGTAPNRIFDIEWRGGYFSGGGTVDFEVRLYENSPTGQFDIIYGTVTQSGTSATIGVQRDTGSIFTQFSCNTASLSAGLKLTFTQPPCGTAGPTNTAGPPTQTPSRTVTPGATATCGGSGGGTPGPWNTASPVPYAIVRYAYAQTGNNFYIMGGVTTGGTITNNTSRFDATTGTWTALAPVPGTLGEAPSAAYWNGRIYFGGGGGFTPFYIYDIAANTWTPGPAMPLGTYGAAAGAFNNKVFFAGGTSTSGPTTNVQVFDIATSTWSVGTPIPGVGFFLGGYQQAGQYLYLVGNYGAAPLANGQSATSVNKRNAKVTAPDANGTETRRLDMTSAPGVWTTGPTWTQARADMGVAYSNGKLYALAGDTNGGGYFDSTVLVDELDVSAWPGGTWVASPPNLPGQVRQANQAGFTSTDGRIWSVGGINGQTFAFTPDVYNRTSGGSVPCATGTVVASVTAVASSTRTATSGPGQTVTAGPTATCVPSAGGWTTGADFPSPQVRGVGVYFPANGRFYVMGGRSSDTAGSDILNPYEYNPTTNTWTVKAAAFADGQVNNMACGVLTQGGTPYIYCVGGSAAGATTSSPSVRRYNPVTDVMTVVAGDDWPGNASGTILPGGFAVLNNKLYIIGGFDINVDMTNQIWEYDPNAGTHWVQKVSLPLNLGYVPATAIGSYIYTAGGSTYDGTLHDSVNTFRFDPVANVLDDAAVPELPNPTAETRALNINGQMWVMGGGREAPNPSNIVQTWTPGAGTWGTGPSFVTARRNFPVDTTGTKIILTGGYAPTAATNNTEIYNIPVQCVGPTPSAVVTIPATTVATSTRTAVASATVQASATAGTSTTPVPATATATATVCPAQFQDVPATDPFYVFIRCLVCRGIISGYTCGGPGEPCVPPNNYPYFRTSSPVTRGQVAKMVSNSAPLTQPIPSTQQTFADVPYGSPFWIWTERLAGMGYISGYGCGGPGEPCDAQNRPYYRPNTPVTRGQLAKIVSNAALFNDPIPSTQQTFQDVPHSNPFWLWIERVAMHGVISGYGCGGPGEPCVPPGNRPYYRWGAPATRGQTAKIVASAFFPGCSTPSRPAMPLTNGVNQ